MGQRHLVFESHGLQTGLGGILQLILTEIGHAPA